MTSGAKRTLLSAAIAAVRDCADTMETQATGLQQALPELSLDGESQAACARVGFRAEGHGRSSDV